MEPRGSESWLWTEVDANGAVEYACSIDPVHDNMAVRHHKDGGKTGAITQGPVLTKAGGTLEFREPEGLAIYRRAGRSTDVDTRSPSGRRGHLGPHGRQPERLVAHRPRRQHSRPQVAYTKA